MNYNFIMLAELPGPPSQPTVVTVAGTEVTLSWSPPTDDGNTPITGYYIESRQLPASKWVRTSKSTTTETTTTVTNLLEKYEYEFRVIAQNKVGPGPPSLGTAPVAIKPLYERPSPPQNVTADQATPSSMAIQWLAPETDGGTPVTHFAVEYKSTSDINWKPLSENVESTSTTLKNLKTGNEYMVRVKAVNKVGASDFATTTSLIKLEPLKPVGTPPTVQSRQESTLTTVEGQELIVTFDVTGEPTPEITWKKAGKPIKSSDERKLSVQDGVATMTMPRIEFLLGAVYTVEARNDLGTAKEEFTVAVQAPPTLRTDQQTFKVIKDETFTLKATFAGTPGPTITWTKDDDTTPLTPRKNLIVDVNHTTTKVVAQKVQPTDAGSYTVSATNPIGDATLTFTVEVVAKPSPPTGPLTVENVQQSSCQLSWAAPENDGGEPVTEYLVEKRDVRKSTWVRVTTVRTDTTTVTAEGLIEGVDYLFRVSAVNRLGQGEPLETEKPVRPKNPFSVPSEPIGPLSSSDVTTDSITLTWTPPESTGGQPLLSYVIEKKEFLKRGWTKIATTEATSTTFTVKKLTEDVEYDFRVFAVNSKGTSEPLQTEKPIKTKSSQQPPSAPEALTVSSVTPESVVVQWAPPTENGGSTLTGYEVVVKDLTEGTSRTRTCKPFDTSFEVTDAKTSHDYTVDVTAVNKLGKSPPATSITITIPKKSGEWPI